jgi:hypothetical protein
MKDKDLFILLNDIANTAKAFKPFEGNPPPNVDLPADHGLEDLIPADITPGWLQRYGLTISGMPLLIALLIKGMRAKGWTSKMILDWLKRYFSNDPTNPGQSDECKRNLKELNDYLKKQSTVDMGGNIQLVLDFLKAAQLLISLVMSQCNFTDDMIELLLLGFLLERLLSAGLTEAQARAYIKLYVEWIRNGANGPMPTPTGSSSDPECAPDEEKIKEKLKDRGLMDDIGEVAWKAAVLAAIIALIALVAGIISGSGGIGTPATIPIIAQIIALAALIGITLSEDDVRAISRDASANCQQTGVDTGGPVEALVKRLKNRNK